MRVEKPEANAAPGKRRRFQFSLRALVSLVLIYAGLWAITAVWGCRLPGRRFIDFESPGQRMEKSRFQEVIAQSPGDHACYYFHATAFGPFLIHVDYACSLQSPTWAYGQASSGKGWVFWFFGYDWWIAGRRSIT